MHAQLSLARVGGEEEALDSAGYEGYEEYIHLPRPLLIPSFNPFRVDLRD